ncbi:MAG: NUMOD4 domain-containing protein, partial [Bacteroidota bacterium]
MEKKSDEIWKKIVFEKIKDQVNHLYVSNLGRIKSNSKQSGGGILSGSLKEGYPSLSLRYMAPRSAKNEKIIQKWREEIEAKKENLKVLI